MNQKDTRSQRQREQDERRLSIQKNNAYFSFVSEVNKPKSSLLSADNERSRSCSPALPSAGHKTWSEECASPLPNTPHPDQVKPTSPSKVAASNATPSATVTMSAELPSNSKQAIALSNIASLVSAASKTATIQTGMDRYIQIKRKLSPQKIRGNVTKINCTNTTHATVESTNNSNRFAALADNEQLTEVGQGAPRNPKPPPIYIREKISNALVNKFVELIGNGNFHVIPLTKGNIHEIKLQAKTEKEFRTATNYLTETKKNFYTYQLKSSKGLQVILKGIEPDVTSAEITSALKEKGFHAARVSNIINKNKKPQPLFKVELEPDSKTLKKNEVHPIYKLQLLLHRRITVEEPHKRNGPVQCSNCQEYGHTKTYCTLRSVCVACGDSHGSDHCQVNKEDPSTKKCGNCGGNHTANYKGCPVYKELKSRMRRVPPTRSQHMSNAIIPSQTTPDVFFAKTARSSFGPINTINGFSYASAVKSGINKPTPSTSLPNVIQAEPNLASVQQQTQSSIEMMIFSLQQSMMDFVTFMKTTMQNLMQNQNTLIQMLASQQSK